MGKTRADAGSGEKLGKMTVSNRVAGDATDGATGNSTGLPGLPNFLDELRQAGRSPHTLRAYACDLKLHTADLSVPALRTYFAGLDGLSAGTRARKQASLSPSAAGPSATG